MDPAHRHLCLVYEGTPSRHLATLANVMRQGLKENYRCLCLNSEAMFDAMRPRLAAAGVNVEQEITRGSLMLSSERDHLVDGSFDVDRMLQNIREALDQALNDGYDGLLGTGDMTWEFGPGKDYSKLLEYERRLEEIFRERPELIAICQYHANTLPRAIVQQGFVSHPSLFISEKLSITNSYYVPPGDPALQQAPGLEYLVNQIYRRVEMN